MNYCSWASFLTSGFEIIKHNFPTGFPIGIFDQFQSHLLLSYRNSWRLLETNTYELFLSPNGYFFDGHSDRLEFMKDSRVICFFSQENIADETKIRYLWWITLAGQAFWHQVAKYIFSEIHIFRYWKCFSDWNFILDSLRILESSWWFIVAGQVFWHQVARLSKQFFQSLLKVSYFSNQNSNSRVIWVFFWRILVTTTDQI